MAPLAKVPKACAFCQSTAAPTKLCYCKTKQFCNQDCWKSFCDADESFKDKCRTSMYKIKTKRLEDKLKTSSNGESSRKYATNEKGQFIETGEKVKKIKKSTEQALKDANQSKGADRKKAVIKYAKLYNEIKPHHKIGIREVAPAGPPKMWYATKGYHALESRSIVPATAISDDADDNHDMDIGLAEPDIEALTFDVAQQRETKKSRIRKYCGICNEAIGAVTGRVKCSVASCQNHNSLHLTCLGFYPKTAEERRVIQRSYFCKDHTPNWAVREHQNPPLTAVIPDFGAENSQPIAKKTVVPFDPSSYMDALDPNPVAISERIKPKFTSRLLAKGASTASETLGRPPQVPASQRPTFLEGFESNNGDFISFVTDNSMKESVMDDILSGDHV